MRPLAVTGGYGDIRPRAVTGRPGGGPTAVRVATDSPRVRALTYGDEWVVRQLFWATVCLGRPLPFRVAEWEAYEGLCLDWFLGPGRRDAAVLIEGGQVSGYALVCTDGEGYRRWQRGRAASFSTRVARRLIAGDLSPEAARFLRLRVRDGWELWRHGVTPPLPAHAHLNLAPAARATIGGRRLAEHVDRRCRLAELPGWYGEMNALAGRRGRALERLGATIVHRAPNHTLTWLLGQPVERLTVVRRLPPASVAGSEVEGQVEAVVGA